MANARQDLKGRAFRLSLKVVRLYPRIVKVNPAYWFIGKQLLRSTCAIGAQLEEGVAASSRRDMAEKYAIGLRESREANYWSRLLEADDSIAELMAPIVQETSEFVAMLTVSVRKLRGPAPVPDLPLPSDL
jgi:four helix bundle protein